ncbi:polysaccharide deacetylase [Thalassotalea sp. 42_200_T64]|nr:polysaccharide deacetylase [Thalassotalea sp. 42_200_T64]
MARAVKLLTKNNKQCALTIDVEDYFHVSAFENIVNRGDWAQLEHRVERNTDRVLELLAEHEAQATFFVLGWVAQKYPQLVKRIVSNGHELASHGYYHQRLTRLTREQAKKDIGDSKTLLEDISGHEVVGYRAPSFSINEDNLWVIDVLQELGFKYSSSTYPVKHDLYGTPSWPRKAHKTAQGILEIPMSTLRFAGVNFPIAGGGYFRLLPLWLSLASINSFLKRENIPYIFYFHPWEIDPHQPRFESAPIKSKLRHYSNLANMENKLIKLLSQHRWRSLHEIYF